MAARSTVRAALATVEAADAAASLADLPALLMPALVNLVGADSALWTELAQAAGPGQPARRLPGRITSYPGPLLDGEAAMALEQHAQDFPLMCHTRPGGDGRPIRRSDLQSMRNFRNSGVYADVVQRIGIDEMLAFALKPGGLHVCISLNRTGPDFTPAAVDLITQLRPLLTRRIEQLAADRADRLAAGGGSIWPGPAVLHAPAAAGAPPRGRRPDRCSNRAPPRLQPENSGQAPGTHLPQAWCLLPHRGYCRRKQESPAQRP
jgi:hypothetical protein